MICPVENVGKDKLIEGDKAGGGLNGITSRYGWVKLPDWVK